MDALLITMVGVSGVGALFG